MVPFVDLAGQYAEIAEDVEPDVFTVLRSGHYVGGPFVDRFERRLGSYLGADHVVSLSDGTAAVQLMMEGLNIGRGDSVLVPNNSFIASAFGVTRAGAKPILCDVDSATGLIDVDEVEGRLKNNKRHAIKAVLVVDLYGQMPNMERLYDLCRKHKVYLLEDAAQSIGATHQKKAVGYYSHAASTSFYPTKNLGGVGQGGAVITNDLSLAKRVRTIAQQGMEGKYEHVCLGGNYRMDPIVAAGLYHSLDRLDHWNERRRAVAYVYNEMFGPGRCPVQQPNSRHVYHLYEFRCKSRDERALLAEKLTAAGIAYGLHYPHLISDTPMYAGAVTPKARELKDTFISLPMFPTLTPAQIEAVVRVVVQTCLIEYPRF